MPYREVYLGDGEYTIARVPDSVIDEWRERRAANKVSGYPDRPPDIDAETLRGWIAHPDEVGYALQRSDLKDNRADFIVYTITAALPEDFVAKLMVTYSEQGYIFTMKVDNDTTGANVQNNKVVKAKWDADFFDNALYIFMDFYGKYSEPMITTYQDVEALKEEKAKAFLDLDQYLAEQEALSGND